jgi:hypothetical protein
MKAPGATGWARWLALGAASALAATALARASAQERPPFPGMLDEHPAIQYAVRPTTDRVSRLNEALARGTMSLARDTRTGYLRSVLGALHVPEESQILVFSKTGIQRDYTSPSNPRALYFDESVVVGYIAGAPALEIAVHDPRQGVIFYTLDQSAASRPAFARRTNCLACHVSASTLEVPGMIARSNMVGAEGRVMPQLGSHAVNHRTPHTQRWGGWFVTGNATAPPYAPLGHLGNLTVSVHPTSGPAIVSDAILIDWLTSAPEAHGYLSPQSDIAALQVFDHQMYAINLLTRLGWQWRVAVHEGGSPASDPSIRDRVNEVADYLLFVGEALPAAEITPRPGFAERLASRFPRDRQGRSLGELDLTRRLLRHPCSFMVYTEAFDALPPPARSAVYRRMLDILSVEDASPEYGHLAPEDRRAILEILRDTKPDFPRERRP